MPPREQPQREYRIEEAILRAFLRQPLCQRPLEKLASADFANYRDQRLDLLQCLQAGLKAR
jgi:hypothetical protein